MSRRCSGEASSRTADGRTRELRDHTAVVGRVGLGEREVDLRVAALADQAAGDGRRPGRRAAPSRCGPRKSCGPGLRATGRPGVARGPRPGRGGRRGRSRRSRRRPGPGWPATRRRTARRRVPAATAGVQSRCDGLLKSPVRKTGMPLRRSACGSTRQHWRQRPPARRSRSSCAARRRAASPCAPGTGRTASTAGGCWRPRRRGRASASTNV